jgi:hypothetical protein
MIYRFKSKADGDLIMLPAVGEQILSLIGKSPAPQGIIEAADLPAAMAAIEQAIAAEDAAYRASIGEAPKSSGENKDEASASAVRLRQRAWPMLEMMKRSSAENADIVWGV